MRRRRQPGERLNRLDAPVAILVARLISSSLGIITGPVIARMLGTDGRGESAAAVSALFIFPILLGMGLPLAVRTAVARASDERTYIRSYRILCLLLIIPALIFAVVGTPFLFGQLSFVSGVVLAVGFSLSPLMVSWMCDESVLIARQKYQQVAVLQLALPVLNCVLIAGGALSGLLSVAWVIGSYSSGTVLTAFVGWYFVRAERGEIAPLKSLFFPSLKFAGSSIAEAASNRLDQVLVLGIIGATQSGLYSAAATFGALAIGVAHSFGGSLFRDVALAADGRSAARTAATRALALGALCALVLLISSPIAIYILFGEAFLPAAGPALILAVGSVFLVLNYVSSVVLVARGQGSALTISQLVGLIVGIVSLFALGPGLGATGAALAAVIGYASTSVVSVRTATGKYSVSMPSLLDFKGALSVLVARGTIRPKGK